jgi:hypothetical protein
MGYRDVTRVYEYVSHQALFVTFFKEYVTSKENRAMKCQVFIIYCLRLDMSKHSC